ncbi:hypothetical protein F2Q70_00002779 [Brassica cretica]|uniref:Uncharacterized protein n=1 Tax=Brassica cretica TaxID=69181 RepID=A0A8S9J4Q6_BRACR|nr:hypothetical protein F2Q70_00002779 [Brassica cretica]
MPKIDVARRNALRPKPKPSEQPLEPVRTPLDDGYNPMEEDRVSTGRTLSRRKEKVAKHLKRRANEKEKENFQKRVFRIPLHKPLEEAYYSHRFGHQKLTDIPHDESVDSSPDDWENDYYNPTIDAYTRQNTHTDEYDEDFEEERAIEYRAIHDEEDKLFHHSSWKKNAPSFDMTSLPSIDTQPQQRCREQALTDTAYYKSVDTDFNRVQEGHYSIGSWANEHHHESFAVETVTYTPGADKLQDSFTDEELLNMQKRDDTDQEPNGYAKAIDGRTLTVSREDIAAILRTANGADNLYMHQRSNREQKTTKEFYDTAGNITGKKKMSMESTEMTANFPEIWMDTPFISFTQTKLVPQIYTKDKINEMFYGVCGEHERNKEAFQMKLDGVYYPLNGSISWLTTCMEEMKKDIARIQNATDTARPPSIDSRQSPSLAKRHHASIDNRLAASIDTNPPRPHTMKSQPDFHTREEIDQLVEGIYRALETTEERLDGRYEHHHESFAVETVTYTPGAEKLQDSFTDEELLNMQKRDDTDQFQAEAAWERTHSSQLIDTHHQQSIDKHPQQSIDTKNTTDPDGYARAIDGRIMTTIRVHNKDIRRLLERASRYEPAYICLPEYASSFTQTKLVPEIYTKDDINEMFYGVCGEHDRNKEAFQMKLDDVYYPLNDSISWLTTCMEEMKKDIARIQNATGTGRPPSIDRRQPQSIDIRQSPSLDMHHHASIDNRLAASIDTNPPRPHTMKSQPNFHTREEIDQLIEGIYRALALTSKVEAIQGELVEIQSYIACRPESSISIDRPNNKSIDTHNSTSIDRDTNRGQLVPKTTSDIQSPSLARRHHASIDNRLAASIDTNPPRPHTMKSQPDFHTREEIDQLVEGIYRALETTEERLDGRCDDIYFPMDLTISALTSKVEAIQGELVEIQSYIARRPEASISIDRRNNKSIDTHNSTSIDSDTNRGRLVPKTTSDMSNTPYHGKEISADTYASLTRHQFNLESLGERLKGIENTTAAMKDKWRRGDEAMRDFTGTWFNKGKEEMDTCFLTSPSS